MHLPVHFPFSIYFTYQSPSPSHSHSAPPLVPRLASLSILPQFNSLHPSPKNLHQPTTSLYSLQLNRYYTSPVTILRLFGSCLPRLPRSTTHKHFQFLVCVYLLQLIPHQLRHARTTATHIMSAYYHYNAHPAHPAPVSHNHHGGRNRRAPRLSVSQQAQRQFRGVRSMKELNETASLTAFRTKFETSRSFDLEDDMEFCPGLLTETDVSYPVTVYVGASI